MIRLMIRLMINNITEKRTGTLSAGRGKIEIKIEGDE